MQPGIDLRLRTMMKALSEVVLPAIDPNNRQAVEQAQVLLGSLNLLREQVDYAHWYEAADLRSVSALARALERIEGYAAPAELASRAERGEALCQRADVALGELRAASADIRESITQAVEAAFAAGASAAARSAVQRLVLDHSVGQVGRERAFVSAARWDGYPESLQTIEASLRAASAA